MRESLEWEPLTHRVAASMLGKRVIAMRGDNKVYVGEVIEVTTSYAVLASGNQRQVLQFGNYRYQVATFKGPTATTPKMAEKRLF